MDAAQNRAAEIVGWVAQHATTRAVAAGPTGAGASLGTTKTHQRHEVPIPRFRATELAEHVRDKKVDDLVFAGIRNGQPLRVSTFRTTFGAAVTAIGVHDLHPHELRHTAASLAIANGVDIKVLHEPKPSVVQ